MSTLLSRYAEAIYWLARYVERAENLARILDVNETFSRDSRGVQNWRSILQLNNDEARFLQTHDEAVAADVIRFYTLDRNNPSSIAAAVRMARENARTLRPLISTEMWIQLNVFYNKLREMQDEELDEPDLTRFCAYVKNTCQAHTGITEGTFYRDEGWCFYQFGRLIERADQTTRLLDVKYHLLLPNEQLRGSPFDVSQWNALLRSAAGYHAYRRVHPRGMSATAAGGFLLFNTRFPRSVAACVAEVSAQLDTLRGHHSLSTGKGARTHLDRLRQALTQDSAEGVVSRGLHEYLDWIQAELIAVSRELGIAYFGHSASQEA